jgi:hypothetical protein
VPIFKSIEWLTDEDHYKITEGNARKLFSRMFAASKGYQFPSFTLREPQGERLETKVIAFFRSC